MTTSLPTLALIEDNHDLREEVQDYLQLRGYSTWSAESAEAFYKTLLTQVADIVLVDLTLPGEDGLEVIDHLRKHSRCGIIAVTARGELQDRLRALEEGVDHYLVKPVNLKELTATIQRLWWRMSSQGVLMTHHTAIPWRLDPALQCLHSPTGNWLDLTAREYTLIEYLVKQPGTVISKESLHRQIFPEEALADTHRIDVILSRIRQKAKAAGLTLPIRAIFGKGLAFV
ncbi:MAG: response regulator transcription factor, partial [Halothiobacillaceae bacterium]